MVPDTKDITVRLDHPGAERRLAELLRQQPEEDRLQFVQDLLATKRDSLFGVALRLAKSCLKERESLLVLLDQGLREADASVIERWLGAVIEGLGFRRVVRVLEARLESDPESVIKARYWLPSWARSGDSPEVQALRHLDEQLVRRTQDDSRLSDWFQQVRGYPVPSSSRSALSPTA